MKSFDAGNDGDYPIMPCYLSRQAMAIHFSSVWHKESICFIVLAVYRVSIDQNVLAWHGLQVSGSKDQECRIPEPIVDEGYVVGVAGRARFVPGKPSLGA